MDVESRKCLGAACFCGAEGGPENNNVYHPIFGLTGDLPWMPDSEDTFAWRELERGRPEGVLQYRERIAGRAEWTALPRPALPTLAEPAWVAAFRTPLPAPSVCLPAGEPAARPDAPNAPPAALPVLIHPGRVAAA